MTEFVEWDEIASRLRGEIATGRRMEIASKAGLTKSAVDHMLAGKSEPAFSKVARVAATLGISLDELAYGPYPVGSVMAGARKAFQDIRYSERQSDETENEPEFVKVRLYDVQASAGSGATSEDNPVSTAIAFRKEWLAKRNTSLANLEALRVRGDSMEPTLRNGDLIVIDRVRTTPGDGIYVIGFENEIQVKRLQRLSPTRLVIASDNPLAGSSEIDLRDETQHPRIIGRVIWLGRDL